LKYNRGCRSLKIEKEDGAMLSFACFRRLGVLDNPKEGVSYFFPGSTSHVAIVRNGVGRIVRLVFLNCLWSEEKDFLEEKVVLDHRDYLEVKKAVACKVVSGQDQVKQEVKLLSERDVFSVNQEILAVPPIPYMSAPLELVFLRDVCRKKKTLIG